MLQIRKRANKLIIRINASLEERREKRSPAMGMKSDSPNRKMRRKWLGIQIDLCSSLPNVRESQS